MSWMKASSLITLEKLNTFGPWKKNLQRYKKPIIETYSESGWWKIVMDQRKKHLVDWVEI